MNKDKHEFIPRLLGVHIRSHLEAQSRGRDGRLRDEAWLLFFSMITADCWFLMSHCIKEMLSTNE